MAGGIRDYNISDDAQIAVHKVLGAGRPQRKSTYALYVDGTYGNDGDTGRSPKHALKTIQKAVDKAGEGFTIYVFPKVHTDYTGDPVSYAETVIIPYTHSGLAIIGVGTGRVQGGLPQMKIGAGSTAMIRIRAPGCLIANVGINGISSTGGGILFDDDYAAKAAFGTTIMNCHFKNCVGSTATNAATGGAIQWSSAGNSWQILIKGNRFYKCVGDVVLPGTSNTVPQDVVIEDNIFSGPAASTDCNLYLQGAGSGINGVIINRNLFTAMPAIGSGTNVRFIHATGCVGVLTNNTFACLTAEAAEGDLTFGASGTGAYIPTTVFMANNWGQSDSTAAAADGAAGEIFRT